LRGRPVYFGAPLQAAILLEQHCGEDDAEAERAALEALPAKRTERLLREKAEPVTP
jgi:hypothetical protein